MNNIGPFEITPWCSGHPIWCELKYEGEVVAKFTHFELRYLKFAVEQAMRQTKNALPELYKDEV